MEEECCHFIRKSQCVYCGPLAEKPMTVLYCESCESNRWHVIGTEEATCCGCKKNRPLNTHEKDIGIAKD